MGRRRNQQAGNQQDSSKMFCAESSHLMLEFYRKSHNLPHELYKNPLLSTGI